MGTRRQEKTGARSERGTQTISTVIKVLDATRNSTEALIVTVLGKRTEARKGEGRSTEEREAPKGKLG